MYVNEAMHAEVFCCHSDTNLEEVAKLMWEKDCGCIPVVSDENKPIGIVTDRDIVMVGMLNHKPLWELDALTVIAGQNLSCCHQDDKLENVLIKMSQHGVRRLPVVGEDGRIEGLISMGDIIAVSGADPAKRGPDCEEVLDMLQHVSAHHSEPNSLR